MSELPFFEFNSLPLRPPEYAATLGPTVVIAPHPDDESLGCGGLLALLAQAGQPVWCVLVSDGTMSHPNSVKFAAPARRALREQELRTALQELGCSSDALLPLNLPDGSVPSPDTEAGAEAVARLVAFLRQTQPHTVLCPWRRDPHPDHRATSLLVQAALAQLSTPPRLLEYVVWAWQRAAPSDLPQPDEAIGWRLEVQPVLARKQRAIAAHRSQLAPSIIDDDPAGFTLSAEMLAHFEQPFEVYLEAR
ncbi:PIG-L deacetylase family protein [Hymenobacter psychrotolerans]|uniref:N-acetylglucosaminyl deacetylase, LmbE family n=1 Tax=Hymenobacter psychrotolerans DSM 18569 TaxID=1121959 RepID=A0A1M6YPQ9_9BACT|nr:PIG-L deacetylase family protein [Hymenobacter psychrotolerans]SHL20311.1 N-acetylglucosaminyl deacetylase, LmbE family [Hymenobacter psychrotolerans DSM 18569]